MGQALQETWLERAADQTRRGRKPAFSPRHSKADDAQEALLHIVGRDPKAFGEERSRWTLEAIQQVCDWLTLRTPSGMWRVLQRLGIHYKRGRSYIHSPDTHYEANEDGSGVATPRQGRA